jgi:uncharacterized protein
VRFSPDELREMSFDELKEHIRLSNVNREEYLEVKQAMLDEMASRNPLNDYRCVKCGHSKYESREMRVSPGLLSAFANWDVAKYSAVVCARCKFAEFYHGDLSDSEFVAEVIFGS